MNTQNNVVPFMRLVSAKEARVSTAEQRRAAILCAPEAEGAFAALAQYLAEKTDLSVAAAIAVIDSCRRSDDKSQSDALAATVAKRKLQTRCVGILTDPAASHDIELAKWLVLETTVAASVAIEVMERTHATESDHV